MYTRRNAGAIPISIAQPHGVCSSVSGVYPIAGILPGATFKSVGTIRVLLVDDSAAFLDSAARFLASDASIEVIGRAQSGAAALAAIECLQTDLVLLDLAMPEMDGWETARRIRALPPPRPRVVIVTMHDNAHYRAQAESLGLDGFVSKSEFGDKLLAKIHALFRVTDRDTAEKS